MKSTKLIELSDGTLVEVDVVPGESRQIAGSVAEKVNSRLSEIQEIITKLGRPIAESCKELCASSNVTKVEFEIGLGFEAEGNIYISKAKGKANIKAKFTVEPTI